MQPNSTAGYCYFSAACRIAAASATLVAVSPARADAPTHRFNVVKIYTDNKYDCGQGHCTTACVMKASLTNLKYHANDAIELAIEFKNSATDAGFSTLSYQFAALKPGSTSDAMEEEAAGYACNKVVVKAIKVRCSDKADGRCHLFVNVQVPKIPSLQIMRQDVSQ